MEIVHCTPSHAPLWDDFVMRNASASFYHRFAWKAINETCFGHSAFFLLARDGDDVRGIFPIVLVRSRIFGKILCSMPFVNLGGPCADGAEAENALMDEAKSILKRTRAKFLEVRSRTRLNTELPASEHKVSMTLDLVEDSEQIWKSFTSKHRNNIRRAYGHGFTTQVGGVELLDPCYDMLQESWRRLGTPLYAKSYFQEVATAFADSIAIFVLLHDGKPVGTAFNGHHRQTVEGMWAGTATEYTGSDCNYVLYWDMIKHYCAAGFGRFHLGRSTVNSGAEAFKKKWLANSAQLFWHHIPGSSGKVPQLNVNNPKFQLAIKTWRHLPLAVTRRIGPVISKGIP